MVINSNRNESLSPFVQQLLKHAPNGDLMKFICLQADDLYARFCSAKSKYESRSGDGIPIESVAKFLGAELQYSHELNDREAEVVQVRRGSYRIRQRRIDNYLWRRFLLAHEIGHIILSRFGNRSHATTSGKLAWQDEAVCNAFAVSLLIPNSSDLSFMDCFEERPLDCIERLRREFQVTLKTAICRIAVLRESTAIFWEWTNPLREQLQTYSIRIVTSYPKGPLFSDWFIPTKCTAKNSRFQPNLVLDCARDQQSKTGDVRINGLGDIPSGSYRMTCVGMEGRMGRSLEKEQWKSDDLTRWGLVSFIRPSE